VIEESVDSPSVHLVLDRLDRCLPDIPPQVVTDRRIMMRQLVIYTWAERERTLADACPLRARSLGSRVRCGALGVGLRPACLPGGGEQLALPAVRVGLLSRHLAWSPQVVTVGG